MISKIYLSARAGTLICRLKEVSDCQIRLRLHSVAAKSSDRSTAILYHLLCHQYDANLFKISTLQNRNATGSSPTSAFDPACAACVFRIIYRTDVLSVRTSGVSLVGPPRPPQKHLKQQKVSTCCTQQLKSIHAKHNSLKLQ